MTPEKEKFYEEATRKLIAAVDGMNMDKMPRIRAKNWVRLFRDSFKLSEVRYKTFWEDLEEDMYKFTYDSDGFCRASSVNFAQLMGADWQVRYIGRRWTYGPHHYLFHIPSKTIFDLTFDQYTNVGIDIPYRLGKPVKIDFDEKQAEGRFADALHLTPLLKIKQKD